MKTENKKLTAALNEFRTKYPNVDSGDIQTFILGFQAAENSTTETTEVLESDNDDEVFILGNYSPNQDEYREIFYKKENKIMPIARVFTENFGYNIDATESKKYCKLFLAAPKLLNVLKFCKSVIESNGVFEASERIAIEKAEKAIDFATNIKTKIV